MTEQPHEAWAIQGDSALHKRVTSLPPMGGGDRSGRHTVPSASTIWVVWSFSTTATRFSRPVRPRIGQMGAFVCTGVLSLGNRAHAGVVGPLPPIIQRL